MASLCLAQRADADALLSRDPLALLIGMVLDQQIPLEHAFAGPLTLTERLGHDLDVKELADYDPEKLAKIFAKPPAIHRFPASMAGRVQELCRIIVADYDGDPTAIWSGARNGLDLRQRIERLPGFGKHKAAIFVALLGKQYGVTPRGWREAAGDFGKRGSLLSVADITDQASLLKVREYKKQMKAQAKKAASPPR
ncbi:MAG TPA: HhH-GPD-type base excision DNA repair protein [Mycobacteriales bacterium]|nr:HhH-GPD-type base excision DNA repair protein [Mycobacteriales bacterium]HWC34191.1 HhH-GPD-type base excision DNA repair protein [Mycobacteriales bacterium]